MGFLDDLVNEDTAYKCIDQGSEEWQEIRLGRFTSSEMHRLMTPAKREMTPAELAARPKKGTGSRTTQILDYSAMSDGAYTYIEEKVAEILTGQAEEDRYVFAKEYGKEMEPVAAEYFQKVTGLTVEPAPFVPFERHAGGSPDRFILQENAGLEIKCPLKAKKQVQYLQLADQNDLLTHFPEFYWQCMSNLLFTEREKWYFVTYCPFMLQEKHKMTKLEIYPREDHFTLITVKIAKAVEEKLKLLKLLQ
jgi:hypothetical protein